MKRWKQRLKFTVPVMGLPLMVPTSAHAALFGLPSTGIPALDAILNSAWAMAAAIVVIAIIVAAVWSAVAWFNARPGEGAAAIGRVIGSVATVLFVMLLVPPALSTAGLF